MGAVKWTVFLLLFFLPFACADFEEKSVKYAEGTMTEEWIGTISGEVTGTDWVEIDYTHPTNERQTAAVASEWIEIGGGKIIPTVYTKDGRAVSKFKITNLAKYGSPATFKLIRSTNFITTSNFGVEGDYDLSVPIGQQTDFLKETQKIEVNDPELRAVAAENFKSSSYMQTLIDITDWVKKNTPYNLCSFNFDNLLSAKTTFSQKSGVCDELSAITAAFARIKGIPTRIVSGVAFHNDGTSGGHAWNEFFLPGTGWIGQDTTWNEIGFVDAQHLANEKADDVDKTGLLATTWSSDKFSFKIKYVDPPKVKIGDIKTFKNLLSVNILTKEVETGTVSEIRVELKNISGKDAIFSPEFFLNKDFMIIDSQQKNIFLKRDETKTVSWKVRAPDKLGDTYYPVVSFIDGTTKGAILIIPPKPPITEQKAAISYGLGLLDKSLLDGLFLKTQ